MFSGCYARCIAPKVLTDNTSVLLDYTQWAMNTLSRVENRIDCEKSGLVWETDSYNFNSFPEALMALFVFSTLDGWAEITRNGVDCVSPGMQPIRDYNPWAYIYFVSFLLVVCFFALNMFVGVVVNNYQTMQREVMAQKNASGQMSEPFNRKSSKADETSFPRLSNRMFINQ